MDLQQISPGCQVPPLITSGALAELDGNGFRLRGARAGKGWTRLQQGEGDGR